MVSILGEDGLHSFVIKVIRKKEFQCYVVILIPESPESQISHNSITIKKIKATVVLYFSTKITQSQVFSVNQNKLQQQFTLINFLKAVKHNQIIGKI